LELAGQEIKENKRRLSDAKKKFVERRNNYYMKKMENSRDGENRVPYNQDKSKLINTLLLQKNLGYYNTSANVNVILPRAGEMDGLVSSLN